MSMVMERWEVKIQDVTLEVIREAENVDTDSYRLEISVDKFARFESNRSSATIVADLTEKDFPRFRKIIRDLAGQKMIRDLAGEKR